MKLGGNLVFIISGSGARSVPIRQIVRGYPLLFFSGPHKN
jgi:hypothetical protein